MRSVELEHYVFQVIETSCKSLPFTAGLRRVPVADSNPEMSLRLVCPSGLLVENGKPGVGHFEYMVIVIANHSSPLQFLELSHIAKQPFFGSIEVWRAISCENLRFALLHICNGIRGRAAREQTGDTDRNTGKLTDDMGTR